MTLVKDEASDEVAKVLADSWIENQRAQVVSVSSDQCSRELYVRLKEVLLNLQFLTLDPVHLPINYDRAHFNKKTAGSKVLRVIMAKFNKVSPAFAAH